MESGNQIRATSTMHYARPVRVLVMVRKPDLNVAETAPAPALPHSVSESPRASNIQGASDVSSASCELDVRSAGLRTDCRPL